MSARVPKGWSEGCLDDVIASISSGVSVNSEDRECNGSEIGILKTSCVLTGVFRAKEHKAVVPDEISRATLPVSRDTVIVSRMNTPDLVGASAYVPTDFPTLYLPDRLWQVRSSQIASARWLGFLIGSSAMRTQLKTIASGTSNSMKNIAQDSFLSLPILVPPPLEQERIVAVLGTWDSAVDQLEQMLTAKMLRFRATRVRLLELENLKNPRRAHEKWRPVELGVIAEELKRRNLAGHGANRVMGVIKGEGLVPMRAHVMSADLRRYLIVPPRAIAYNPMRLNIGSIAASHFDHDVLVRPDYVVFRARAGRADPDFLRHLIGTKRWRDHLARVGSGSVRTRIYFEGLGEMLLRVPSVLEQKRIGQTLSALEQDLIATNNMLSALRLQKRELTKRLLTGEWRLDERFEPHTPPEYQPTARSIA